MLFALCASPSGEIYSQESTFPLHNDAQLINLNEGWKLLDSTYVFKHEEYAADHPDSNRVATLKVLGIAINTYFKLI